MPMTRSIRVFGVCVAVVMIYAVGCVNSGGADAETRTSVCQIANYGPNQDGNRVRFRAVYISDVVERTVLKDVKCPNSWVGLGEQQNGIDDKSVTELEDAVRGDVVNDLELRQFVVELSGVYKWTGQMGHGVITITKVWNFKRINGDWKKADMVE